MPQLPLAGSLLPKEPKLLLPAGVAASKNRKPKSPAGAKVDLVTMFLATSLSNPSGWQQPLTH